MDYLQAALQMVGYDLPQHKIRDLINDLESKGKLINGGIDKNLLIEVKFHKSIVTNSHKQ